MFQLDVADCYRRSNVVGRSVCLSVDHDREPSRTTERTASGL